VDDGQLRWDPVLGCFTLLTETPLVTTPANRLYAAGGRYALCTMCIGVGQVKSIALILGV